MGRERRGEPRYVVDGLNAEVDGAQRMILDIAPSSVRLFRDAGDEPAPTVALRLWSAPGFPKVDSVCAAHLIRSTRHELVYGFTLPLPAWPALLPKFDSFKDLHVAGLEG
jgi:hypothetical protein